MITKSPYGFGYGHKGRIAGTEPEWEPREYVRKPDPQPLKDRCLNCTKKTCAGNCDVNSYVNSRRRFRERESLREQRRLLAEAKDRKDTERATKVARMCIDGWRESAIARELGLTVDEVKQSIKLARKKGLLY